ERARRHLAPHKLLLRFRPRSSSFSNLTLVERIRRNPISRFSCNWWAKIKSLVTLSFSMSLQCSNSRYSPWTIWESMARKVFSKCSLYSELDTLGMRVSMTGSVSDSSDLFLANTRALRLRARNRSDGPFTWLRYDLVSRLFNATCLIASIFRCPSARVMDLETC